MADVRREIRFVINDRDVVVSQVSPEDTLLDFIRIDRGLHGTKEGCAEGDCGACTVLVGRLRRGVLHYESANACIRMLASVDGCHVVTVEHLRGATGGLNPVQQALVDRHGSQCGFCTPGIVMSLYALWMTRPDPSVEDVQTALQGNLCRCTGYRPIIDAALEASRNGNPSTDILITGREAMTARLKTLADGCRVEVEKARKRAILPADGFDLEDILSREPEATIVAGATDVGLWVTKAMRHISPAIFIGNLEELKEIEVDDNEVRIGAGVTYSECATTIIETYPHLARFWPRIGGWQVRNMGTIGGNIANGSPIGDTPPVLIALGAKITLRSKGGKRTLPLESFFLDYGKQDRAPQEFVERITIPRLKARTKVAAYKVSKRQDEDISSVCCGCFLAMDGDTIAEARLAYGGMAATPRRATGAEQALVGKVWSRNTVSAAVEALAHDFEPLSDWRASAAYRAMVAGNLLHRFYHETTNHGGEEYGEQV